MSASRAGRPLAERRTGSIGEYATTSEVEDHGCRYDGYDLVWVRSDQHSEVPLLEVRHHPISGRQPVCAPTREADGVNSVDEVAGVECIRLAGAWSAPAYIYCRDRSIRNDHCGRSCLPTTAGSLVMSDQHTDDIGQRADAEWIGRLSLVRYGHDSDRSRNIERRPTGSVRDVLTGPDFPNTARVRLMGHIKSGFGELIHRGRETALLWAAIGPDTKRGRRFGAFGRRSVICFPPNTIMNERYIQIGSETMIGPYVSLSAGMVPGQECVTNPVVKIGDRCLIGRGSGIVGHLSIEIGNDVWTGHHVYITDQNHGYDDPSLPISQQLQPERSVSIGDGSWLGHGTVVLPGAQIGRNVVIGANSVVSGVIPDYSVAVGAPAKVIKRTPT